MGVYFVHEMSLQFCHVCSVYQILVWATPRSASHYRPCGWHPAKQFRRLWDMVDQSHVFRWRRELKLRSASAEEHKVTESVFQSLQKYFWHQLTCYKLQSWLQTNWWPHTINETLPAMSSKFKTWITRREKYAGGENMVTSLTALVWKNARRECLNWFIVFLTFM